MRGIFDHKPSDMVFVVGRLEIPPLGGEQPMDKSARIKNRSGPIRRRDMVPPGWRGRKSSLYLQVDRSLRLHRERHPPLLSICDEVALLWPDLRSILLVCPTYRCISDLAGSPSLPESYFDMQHGGRLKRPYHLSRRRLDGERGGRRHRDPGRRTPETGKRGGRRGGKGHPVRLTSIQLHLASRCCCAEPHWRWSATFHHRRAGWGTLSTSSR